MLLRLFSVDQMSAKVDVFLLFRPVGLFCRHLQHRGRVLFWYMTIYPLVGFTCRVCSLGDRKEGGWNFNNLGSTRLLGRMST